MNWRRNQRWSALTSSTSGWSVPGCDSQPASASRWTLRFWGAASGLMSSSSLWNSRSLYLLPAAETSWKHHFSPPVFADLVSSWLFRTLMSLMWLAAVKVRLSLILFFLTAKTTENIILEYFRAPDGQWFQSHSWDLYGKVPLIKILELKVCRPVLNVGADWWF